METKITYKGKGSSKDYGKGSSKDYGKGSFEDYGKGSFEDINIKEIIERQQHNKLSNLKIEYGDLIQMIFKSEINYILHQCNCCSITKRDYDNKIENGFAKILFDQIIDADIYCKRPREKFDDKYFLYID